MDVHLAPAGPQLLRWLLDTQQQRGWAIDARLLSYAYGLAAAEEAAVGPPSEPSGVPPPWEVQAEAAPPQPPATGAPSPREAAPPHAPRRLLQRAVAALDGWGARLVPEAVADPGFLAGLAVGGGLAAVLMLTLARHV